MKQVRCKTCGVELHGRYCATCGEKVLEEKDKSLKSWFSEVFANLAMLDGRVIFTIRQLFLKPGSYAANFTSGIRVPYLRPLNLFLVVNLIYFVFSTFNTFKTPLYVQMNGVPYSNYVTKVVEDKLESENLTLEYFRSEYNNKTNEISKLMLILLAPMLGLVFFFLFKKQGLFLTDGFNLALQFWSFFITFFLLVMPVLLVLILTIIPKVNQLGEVFTSSIILVGSMIYSGFMLQPWKKNSGFRFFIKLLLIGISFYPMLIIYRGILFLITLSSL